MKKNGQMKYSDGTIINSNYGDTTKPTENIKFPTIDINKGDNITGISKLAQLKKCKKIQSIHIQKIKWQTRIYRKSYLEIIIGLLLAV